MSQRPPAISMAGGPSSGSVPAVPAVPYPDLSELEKEAVEEALRVAWSKLPAAADAENVNLMVVGEVPITRLLRKEVDKLRTDEAQPVPGFSEATFQHVPES